MEPSREKEESISSDQHVDYVLVYDKDDKIYQQSRRYFEKAMKFAGLVFTKETIGAEVFVLITCPFERLAFEAEQVKLEMDLKGCSVEKSESFLFANIKSYFETDDEVDFVSGPFERAKLHLFEGYENHRTFFRSAQRCLLVNHILINLDYSLHDKEHDSLDARTSLNVLTFSTQPDSRRKGLPYLLVKKVYKDAFVLHDQSTEDPANLRLKEKYPDQYILLEHLNRLKSDPRKEMKDTWLNFFKFQPMWKIRNYFGEKIAFYFAWEGVYVTMLWAPAILGLISFIYGFYKSRQTHKFELCDCNCRNLSQNGTFSYDCNQVDTPDSFVAGFYDTVEETFNNDMNPFFALFVCLWGTLFMEIWKRKNITLAYEWDVNGFDSSEPDRPEFFGVKTRTDPVTKEILWVFPSRTRLKRQLISIIAILCMMLIVGLTIGVVILLQVEMRSYWKCIDAVSIPNCNSLCVESHMTRGSATTCFVMTAILPALVNSLSVVFWEYIYTKLAINLTTLENHQTQSDYNDSLILKLFAFQFVNSYAYLAYIAVFRPSDHQLEEDGLFGMGDNYRDNCKKSRCMSYLTVQILLLMITKPLIKIVYDVVRPYVLRKSYLISNYIQLKICKRDKTTVRKKSSVFSVDAFNVSYLKRERNKAPLNDFSLETFSEKVIQFGYVVMFTVAFPLAPVIALVVSLLDLRFDAHRLLWFNRRPVAFLARDIGTWQPILQFLNFCGVITNSFLVATGSPITKERDVETKLYIMLIFEHCIFFLMYLCQVIIPDVPARIKEAMRREKYQVNKVLAEGYIPTASLSPSGSHRVYSATSAVSKKQHNGLSHGIAMIRRGKSSAEVQPLTLVSPRRSNGGDGVPPVQNIPQLQDILSLDNSPKELKCANLLG